MVFEIRQESTLPVLKMKLAMTDYSKQNEIYTRFENAVVLFSMWDADNDKYIILNKPAEIITEKNIIESNYENTIYIQYKFTSKETKKIGMYRGEFLIQFTDDNLDQLRVPIQKPLYINIKRNYTKTEVVKANC